MSSSRSCGPYLNYPERRFQLASHDARAITMTDPQIDDSTQPRKRIAVAVSYAFSFFSFVMSWYQHIPFPFPLRENSLVSTKAKAHS